MKKIVSYIFLPLFFLILSLVAHSQVSPKIVDAIITWNNTDSLTNADLAIYVTDTVSVTGIEIQIDSILDGNGIYNQQFDLSALPAGSKVDEGTIILDLGELLPAADYYSWIKLILGGEIAEELKIHTVK